MAVGMGTIITITTIVTTTTGAVDLRAGVYSRGSAGGWSGTRLAGSGGGDGVRVVAVAAVVVVMMAVVWEGRRLR